MRTWSIPVGRLFGVEIRIHVSFALVLLLAGFGQRKFSAIDPARGIALVAIIFGAVILHELGHALVGRHSGMPARAIVLLPIGGVTIFDESQPPIPQFWLELPYRICECGPILMSARTICPTAWSGQICGWRFSICSPPIPWTVAVSCGGCSLGRWMPSVQPAARSALAAALPLPLCLRVGGITGFP